MVLKFLGLGKKSEFYMEADSQSKNGSDPAKTKSAKTEPAKAEPAQVAEPAEATEAPAPESAPTAAKATATKAKQTKKEAPAPAVAPAPAAVSKPSVPAATGFATSSYASNTPRRRPGPSLDGFKDMARNMNNSR